MINLLDPGPNHDRLYCLNGAEFSMYPGSLWLLRCMGRRL